MPLPTLTPAQRAAALEKAAQTRTARAQARAQLRSGELSPLDVLRAPTDSPAGDLRVEQLLVSLPGIGKARATALLATAGIPSTRRVPAGPAGVSAGLAQHKCIVGSLLINSRGRNGPPNGRGQERPHDQDCGA